MDIKVTYTLARWAVSEREQAYKYSVNPTIKLLDTWARLKALAGQSSLIQGWQQQSLPQILDSSRSVVYRRLDDLQRKGWLSWYNGRITLISWAELHRRLGLPYKKDFFTHTKLNDKKQRYCWLYLAECLDNKDRQLYSIAKKVNKNHSIRAEAYAALKQQGADIEQCESNPQYLAGQLQKAYRHGFITGGSAIYQALTLVRPFTTRSATGMGKRYNNDSTPTRELDNRTKAKYAALGGYIKRLMSKSLVAQCIPVPSIESEARQRNEHAYVMWNRWNKTTFHTFCDEIEQVIMAQDAACQADCIAADRAPANTAVSAGAGHKF